MIREQLTKRLRTLHTLNETLSAMKSLSAHHFLLSHRTLEPARQYRNEIDQMICQVGIRPGNHQSGLPGVLLVTSDLGLCGDYNSRLTRFAVDHVQKHPGALCYVIGRRGRVAMARNSIACERIYSAPASTGGLPMRLLEIAQDIVRDYSEQRISGQNVLAAMFVGAGRFTPVSTQLMPIAANSDRLPVEAHWQSRQHLQEVVEREYLYVTLYELLLDALATEHGMRLVAAENARRWIEDTQQSIHRQLSAVRRENSTQDVMDIVGASRKLKKGR